MFCSFKVYPGTKHDTMNLSELVAYLPFIFNLNKHMYAVGIIFLIKYLLGTFLS